MTKPTIRQRLLGGFIFWQLIFIVAANVLFFLERTFSTPGISMASAVTNRWAEATGQLQGWSLYAPSVPTQAAFVVTELRWADGRTEKLTSGNEPEDLGHFFRPPGSGRLLNYEAHLPLALLTWSARDVQENPDHWQQHLEAEVRRRAAALKAYLEWRCREFQVQHPNSSAPAERVLWVRLYGIPPPGSVPWSWREPVEVPLLRWRPGQTPPADRQPLEWFDVTSREFRWVDDGRSQR